MLHMNIQPTPLDLSLSINQGSQVHGMNENQGESSFSSMIEQAQEASTTDGNQTHNIEETQKTDDFDSKKIEKSDLEEKTLNEELNSQKKSEEPFDVKIEEKVFSISQQNQLENFETKLSQSQNVDSTNLLEIEPISEEIIGKLEAFSKNVDLSKVSEVKDLNVKNPKINSKNLEKEEFFSLIEDLKSKAKDNPEDLEILEDAFPFIKAENQLVEKNLNNQENFSLENQLIAELQNPEQTDGKISVIDMRTEQVAEKIENPENSLITKEAAKKSDFVKTIEYDSNGNATISLSLKGENQVVDNGVVQTSSQDFSSMLSKEIASSANDLVKTGSIILKDNNAGTINLILNPEELGSVKIKLEISDNQITGKILVASKEAYDAFNQNINLLKNAFIESGFTAGGFDLAFTGSNQQGDFGQNGGQNQPSQSEINYKAVVYEQNVAEVSPESTTSTSTINLVA